MSLKMPVIQMIQKLGLAGLCHLSTDLLENLRLPKVTKMTAPMTATSTIHFDEKDPFNSIMSALPTNTAAAQ